MTTVQLAILVAMVSVWAWVLGRPLLQNMFNVARRDPVGHFNKRMTVLGRAPERSLAHDAGVPTNQSWSRQPPRKRRLQLMMGLIIAVSVSAVLALVFRGIFLWQLSLLGAMLLGYVGLAARAGAYEAERGSKVSYLHTTGSPRPVRIQAVGDR